VHVKIRDFCYAALSVLALSACDAAEPRYAASDAGTAIRGAVLLAPGVQAPDSGTLFVIARGAGSGPPLAVRRLALGPFPLTFKIGPSDSPHPGSRFEGPIFLGARVDADGDVATRDSDALGAVAPRVLEPGATGVELVLVPNAHPPESATLPR
jgi:hypothetical protein